MKQGDLVHWINEEKKEIVWLVTENDDVGIVVHSDGLVSVGATMNLLRMPNIKPFVGSLTMNSIANN